MRPPHRYRRNGPKALLQALTPPAAPMESRPKRRGTRAWIVVPRLGCESIESVPFTSFSPSCMWSKPSFPDPRHFEVKAHAESLRPGFNPRNSRLHDRNRYGSSTVRTYVSAILRTHTLHLLEQGHFRVDFLGRLSPSVRRIPGCARSAIRFL
jgi:hypothetical protein